MTPFGILSLLSMITVSSGLDRVMRSEKNKYGDTCSKVCRDLPDDDIQPVCMMFSRYKRGYQFFVNLCHARRSICRDNLILQMVHPIRCLKTKQFYMPIN